MLFRMITPRISKSRSIDVREGIPKDVRADYERLYGQKWEAKLTLPAGTKPQEVKVRTGEFMAEVETRIEAIRAAKRLLNKLSVDPGPALLAESVEQQQLIGSANQTEAVRANLEKRSPRFAD